jgi:molybdopterin molybdotransferase
VTALAANDKRQDYVRARLFRGSDGTMKVERFSRQDSSMMQVFARSDCLIIRAPFAPEAKAGTICDILILRQPVL